MDCSAGTLCFEMAKGLPAAIVALVIGSLAAWITWRQYVAASTKIKLDIFEKRYDVFEKTWTFMSEVVQLGQGESPLSPFTNVIPQARFLFGPQIETYLQEASAKRTELWIIHQKTRQSGDSMPPEDAKRFADLSTWFSTEASTGLKEKFSPYLSFENWK